MSQGDRTYRIIVDSIERKDLASEVSISWNSKAMGGRITGSKTINVKATGDYTVTNMELRDDGDQKLLITFSDPILTNQNFEGCSEETWERRLVRF
jgi:hypothetical protein